MSSESSAYLTVPSADSAKKIKCEQNKIMNMNSLSLCLRLSLRCVLSPGIGPLKAPSPSSTLVEKQQNLSSTQQPHKAYANFHNLTEDYRGNFQSCFHFGETYRAEQNINTHVPAEPHNYNTQTHNGLHTGCSNT
ncbi:zinc finger protein GLIS1-like isoform X1, partial [Clarias magur]